MRAARDRAPPRTTEHSITISAPHPAQNRTGRWDNPICCFYCLCWNTCSGKAIKQVNVYHLHHSYVSVFCKAFTPQRTSHDLDARRDGRHRPPNGTMCDSEVVYMTTHHEPSYHKAWSAAPGRMSSGFGAGLTSTRPLRMTIVVDVLPPIKPPVLKPGHSIAWPSNNLARCGSGRPTHRRHHCYCCSHPYPLILVRMVHRMSPRQQPGSWQGC